MILKRMYGRKWIIRFSGSTVLPWEGEAILWGWGKKVDLWRKSLRSLNGKRVTI